MRKLRKLRKLKMCALVGCVTAFGASGVCFSEGLSVLRQALLPFESTPGMCFQLEFGDSLIEIPCSILD